jgi:hypothetical protein
MFEQPFVLYRDSSLNDTAEFNAIRSVVANSDDPSNIVPGSVVFPRFRTIPFGKELAQSVEDNGSQLINSWEQYLYVSDLHNWVKDLGDLTPSAYSVENIPDLPEGEYFVKGVTNSVKHDWLGSAFAPTVDDVSRVVDNLSQHSVVGSQDVVIRPFVRYRQLAVMETSQPVFNEWRVFVLNGQIMAKGFYWSKQQHLFDISEIQPLNIELFYNTIQEAIRLIGDRINFVVIDVAEKPDDSWDVIELNDGNMSGLCGVSPKILWGNIRDYYCK